jgi:class 3 adenylate cyclase/tetratricopeptide (TPR) repeat protein
VLFADICGYTAMCARSDAEQVRHMLGRFFDVMDKVVEAHGGHVFDHAGDAVMAVFGAPLAHGNDAQRALRAALAMHAAAVTVPDCDGASICLHIGVASGEVVAAMIGGGSQPKYSVTGEAVNLAARLDALATAGETLISDALYQEVSECVEAQPAGDQVLKGLSAPVTVWRVLRLRESRGERRPLVGRQAELRQLIGALAAARDSGAGATLLVRGDAGIGKSRLIGEFRSLAAERGFGTAMGHVLDFGVGKGQNTLAMLLKALFGIGPLADERARSAALHAAVEGGLVAADDVMFVNEWLDLPQTGDLEARYEAMDNATRQRRACDALTALLRRAAALRPQLLLVEDIHWASPELLRQLAAIARAASQAPLVLLLSSRIEGDPIDKAWRASIHGCSLMSIDLAPLRPHEAQLLAGQLLDATSPFLAQCIERAEGNPLFLEQLLRTARAADGSSPAPTVPPTIRSLVLERMDRLAPDDREALQAAAVLGKRFSLSSLRGVGGRPHARIEALVAADLVRPDAEDYLFAHALIQEAVYVSTLKSRRRELHRAAASWFGELDPVLQAEHLDRAEDTAAAAAYLRAAGAEAARLRFEAALRLAERGGLLAAQLPQVDATTGCQLALLRAEVLHELGRSAESIAVYQLALALAADDLQRCRAWLGAAAGHRVTGDFAAAMDALGHAETIATRLGLTIELSRIHHTRGNLFFAQGRIDECDAQHVTALRLAEQCGDTESQARALSGLGDARYAQGHMRSALEYFKRCVALSEGQIRIAGPNRCMIGHCLWYENQLPTAIAEARAARDDAARGGVVQVELFAQISLTQFLAEAGRHDEADAACEQALLLARQVGSRRYESLALSEVARRQLQRDQLAQARDTLQQALALAQQTGLGFIGAKLHALLSHTASSAAERALCLADGAALLQQTGLAHNHLWFHRFAIESTLAAGEWQAALDHAGALEQSFQAEALPWVALVVERARAIVAAAGGEHGAMARLQRVRAIAVACGVGCALQGIDAALAKSAARRA